MALAFTSASRNQTVSTDNFNQDVIVTLYFTNDGVDPINVMPHGDSMGFDILEMGMGEIEVRLMPADGTLSAGTKNITIDIEDMMAGEMDSTNLTINVSQGVAPSLKSYIRLKPGSTVNGISFNGNGQSLTFGSSEISLSSKVGTVFSEKGGDYESDLYVLEYTPSNGSYPESTTANVGISITGGGNWLGSESIDSETQRTYTFGTESVKLIRNDLFIEVSATSESATNLSTTDFDQTIYTLTTTATSGENFAISGRGANPPTFAISNATGSSVVSLYKPDAPLNSGDTGTIYMRYHSQNSLSTPTVSSYFDVYLTWAASTVNVLPVVSSSSVSVAERVATIDFGALHSDSNGDAITYAFAGGTDDNLFTLNTSTGVATWNSTSTPGSYSVDINASDGAGTTRTTFAITVTNINDRPVVVSGVVSVDAGDVSFDASALFSDPDNDVLTYSITGGATSKFTVNSSTGLVSFVDPATDSVSGNSMNVEITASDGSLSIANLVTVNVSATPASAIEGLSGSLLENGHDFEASGSVLTVDKAALITRGGNAGAKVYAAEFTNIQHVNGITIANGNNTIALFAGNSSARYGTNFDDDTYGELSEFTLTIPDGGKVRVKWLEITQ